MKYLLNIIIILSFTQGYSQVKQKIYVDNNEDYVLFLDSSISTQDKSFGSTEVDAFVSVKNKKFQYTVLVSKIFEHNFTGGNLLDVEYEEYFKSTCNCIILDGEIVIYNNVKTLRFNIEAARNGEKFIGYNDSFVSGDILYNLLFLTFEKDFEEHKSEYSNIMNSLMINGKTTIDSYKEYEETR